MELFFDLFVFSGRGVRLVMGSRSSGGVYVLLRRRLIFNHYTSK